MTLTLTGEQEELVRQVAEWRGFASAEAFVGEALGEIIEREVYLHEHRDEISAMIDEGWEELERGETLSAEEAKQQISEWKQEFLAIRPAAA